MTENTITIFLQDIAERFSSLIAALFEAVPDFAYIYNHVVRWIFPVLAGVVLFRCLHSLLRGGSQHEVWGFLSLDNGARLPIKHWENAIGRAKSCDLVLNFPSVSRSHAVLMRNDDGGWIVEDLHSKGGTTVKGRAISEKTPVYFGDSMSFAGVNAVLVPLSPEEQGILEERRETPEISEKAPVTLWLLSMIQILCAIQLALASEPEYALWMTITMLALCVLMWIYYAVMRSIGRTGLEVEAIAFFLCTLNLAVVSSSAPESVFKQFAAIVIGIVLFLVMGLCLRDLTRAVKLRWLMAAGAVALLALNLLFGFIAFGSRNWISLGFLSVQPSELVKIAFIYAGSATLDRLFARRNLALFIVLSGFCILTLAYLSDFGTAAIFFASFIVIAFLRSGDLAAVVSICAAAVFGIFIILQVRPYIADRFSSWGHIWDDPFGSGFQQTRALIAAASGGLAGVGVGKGNLVDIGAADTDLVFAVLCEEWGLVIALLAPLCIAGLAVFTVRQATTARSSFYVIAACGAMSMLVVQTMLNTLGCLDILPFTGVTLPFVSNGGTSMVSSWGLLAFVKACDTRRNSSWVTRAQDELGGVLL